MTQVIGPSYSNNNGKHQDMDDSGILKAKNLGRVIPVRLSDEHWILIKQQADQIGIGASTLARIWIIESLRKAADGRK